MTERHLMFEWFDDWHSTMIIISIQCFRTVLKWNVKCTHMPLFVELAVLLMDGACIPFGWCNHHHIPSTSTSVARHSTTVSFNRFVVKNSYNDRKKKSTVINILTYIFIHGKSNVVDSKLLLCRWTPARIKSIPIIH
jgi:hypothetical protein